MADAVLWQILEAVQTGLQNALTFSPQGQDTVATIKNEAIVIRKLEGDSDGNAVGKADELCPGIIITPPNTVICDPSEGTNLRDDVDYAVLCQIIDRDNQTKLTNLRSYLKWQEKIRKYFNQQGLSAVQTSDGIVNRVLCEQVQVVDRAHWVRHQLFRAGVVIRAISREPRGVT